VLCAYRSAETGCCLRHYLTSLLLQEYGADAADLSALWFDADSPCDGDDMLFPKGYSQIVQAVARELHDVIRLQHNVTRICYGGSSVCSCSSCSCYHSTEPGGSSSACMQTPSVYHCSEVNSNAASNASLDQQDGCCKYSSSSSSSGVTVHAESPSGSVTFQARHAIVTFPIGMLKAHSSSLFEPPLPAEKQAAIAKLGVGLLDKVGPIIKVQRLAGYLLFAQHCDQLELPLAGDRISAINITNVAPTGKLRPQLHCQRQTAAFKLATFAYSAAADC
jgi:hypothetical protein